MTLTELGMNLSALNGMPPLNITVVVTPEAIVSSVESSTEGYLAYLILIGLFVVVYLLLSDKREAWSFGYSDARASSITFSITTIILIKLMEAGFIVNFLAITLSAFLFLISYIFILIYENKE